MRAFLRGGVSAGVIALAIGALAIDASAQQFKPAGRSGPERGYTEDLSSFLPPANGTQRMGVNAGHISNVIFDPSNPLRMFAGAVNGGVWQSLDGGVHWTPLTDQLSSLAISSLAMDATNSNTLIAGTGLQGTGAFTPGFNVFTDRSPAARNGVIQISRNGGSSWQEIQIAGLSGQTISSVAIRGNTIMATGYDFNNSAQAGGLYRSTDGGLTFSAVTLGARAPTSQASSLVADPTNPNTFYVSSFISGGSAQVFKTTDGGATWANILSVGSGITSLKIATGPGGSVAVYGVNVNVGKSNFLAYSSNGGTSFTSLNAQLVTLLSGIGQLNGGGQANFHAGIAINPNNPNEIFLSGDSVQSFAVANGFYVPLYKINASTLTVTNMTALGLTSQSFAHADVTNLTFDPTGRLVTAGDGGIFRLSTTDPTTASWSGLAGTLGTKEQYSVAYDARNKLIATASQDNGSAIQLSRDSGATFTILGGDGINARINDTWAGGSYLYTSAQGLGGINRALITPGSPDGFGSFRVFLGFNTSAGSEPLVFGGSEEFNPQWEAFLSSRGQLATGELGEIADIPDLDPLTYDPTITLRFSSPFILNRVNQTKFAFGGSNVWVGQDTPGNVTGCFAPTPNSVVTDCFDDSLVVTSIAASTGPTLPLTTPNSYTTVTSLAYGVVDAPDAVLVGGRRFVGNPRLGLSTTGTLNSLLTFNNYGQGSTGVSVGPAAFADQPSSVLFDPRTVSRIFVADSFGVYGSTNATIAGATNANATFTDFTGLLPANFSRPTSLEFISKFGVNALLVGGINTTANAGNPLVTADSDAAGNLSGWRRLGTGLPNTGINTMAYNPIVDVLAVSAYGRGSWILYDVTTNYASATQLVFGLADNDSNPDIALLTGNRPLIKNGTGTLTVTGNANYTGPTTINGGTMILNGSILGNLLINPGTIFGGNATVAGSITNFGILSPGNSPGIVTAGSYVGGGVLLSQVQFDNANAPVNGSTHDLLNVMGNVTGAPTSVNVVPIAPSGAPKGTTGTGIQLVKVGGTVSSTAFTLPAPVFQGGFEYLLKYLPSSSAGQGFFLQSASRQELALNSAMLSASRAAFFGCARQIAGSPDLAGGKGRGWIGAEHGTFDTNASTGTDSKSDYDCYGGGVTFAATPTVQFGVSGGTGTVSTDVNLFQGKATMDGDTSMVQVNMSLVRPSGLFGTVTMGYSDTDWSAKGVYGAKFAATVAGLTGSLRVGDAHRIGEKTMLTLAATLDYNGVRCGENCLFAGTTETPNTFVGAIDARLDTTYLFLRPFFGAQVSTDFGKGNRVSLGNAVAIADTQSYLLNVEAGFDAPVSDDFSIFAKGGLTEGLDSDVSGYKGAAGLVARW